MQAVAGSMTTLDEGDGAASNGLLTSLIANWGLDEAAGANNALDKHTNGLTLTQAGSPGSATGKVYAGARSWTTNGQCFQRTMETALQTGGATFAIAVWIYPADANIRAICTTIPGDVSSPGFQIARLNNRKTRFGVVVSSQFYIDSADTASDNQWSLIIVQHDAVTKKIAISINNGTLVESSAYTGTTGNATLPFTIGDYADKYASSLYSWRGRMGPISFWKGRTLDADARTLIYNAGAGLAYSGFS